MKSTAGIATLLAEGIGDTIRFSLTADPVEEAKAGRQLLEALGLRERKGLDLIACPSCGRAEVDVIQVARDAQDALEARNIPLQVAVMGCVVNGPGEARDADLGIAAGRGKGHLFVRGQVVRVVPEAEMVDALVDEAETIVAEGIEARLAAADENAEAIAAATREELLQIQGTRRQPQRREDRPHPRDRRLTRGPGPRDGGRSTSTAPAAVHTTPITAQSASPVMNDPSITPTPWKNQTRPTTRSTSPIARRIHIAPTLRGASRSRSAESAFGFRGGRRRVAVHDALEDAAKSAPVPGSLGSNAPAQRMVVPPSVAARRSMSAW